MDIVRCLTLLSVPLAYAFGALSFAQLLLVAVIVAAADIAFRAASGACRHGLVGPEHPLRANDRFESTAGTATLLGPPIGGLAIGVFGPRVKVIANAFFFSRRRRHTRLTCDWSSDVCSSDLGRARRSCSGRRAVGRRARRPEQERRDLEAVERQVGDVLGRDVGRALDSERGGGVDGARQIGRASCRE